MPAPREPEPIQRKHPPATVARYRADRAKRWALNGATVGFLVGAVAGIIFLGPRVREWGFVGTAMVGAFSALSGMLLGYFAFSIIGAGTASGASLGGGDTGGFSDGGGDGDGDGE